MFLDASAIVAILTGETDAGELIAKIERATKPIYFSPLSAFEATISIARITWLSQGGENKPTPALMIDAARRDVESFFEITGAKEMAIGGGLHRPNRPKAAILANSTNVVGTYRAGLTCDAPVHDIALQFEERHNEYGYFEFGFC